MPQIFRFGSYWAYFGLMRICHWNLYMFTYSGRPTLTLHGIRPFLSQKSQVGLISAPPASVYC